MDNPFVKAFLERQAVAAKPKNTKVGVIAIRTTGKAEGDDQKKGIREFAKSKPTGKDVEKYFRDKISQLEKEEEEEAR